MEPTPDRHVADAVAAATWPAGRNVVCKLLLIGHGSFQLGSVTSGMAAGSALHTLPEIKLTLFFGGQVLVAPSSDLTSGYRYA